MPKLYKPLIGIILSIWLPQMALSEVLSLDVAVQEVAFKPPTPPKPAEPEPGPAPLPPPSKPLPPSPSDTFPWPWRTQCPVVDHDVAGNWRVPGKPEAGYYSFSLIEQISDGTRIYKVEHRSQSGVLIAEGRGHILPHQNHAWAALESVSGDEEPTWLIWRVFEDDFATGGASTDCVGLVDYVLTIGSIGPKDVRPELNLVVERDPQSQIYSSMLDTALGMR